MGGFVETRTARVVRTNDQGFAESVMTILPRLRFDPAMPNGAPVRQITTLTQGMQIGRVVVAAGQSPTAAMAAERRTAPKC